MMNSTFRETSRQLLVVLAVLALLSAVSWAQTGTGEINGLVTDPSGAVVANLQVTLTNTATGEKRTTQTTSSGDYHFPALSIVGTYTIAISPKGFKAVKVEGIVISVGIISTHDIRLEVGGGNEQITVEAGAERVQTTESQLSDLVPRQVWQDMPLEVRNQNSFIELLAGASPQDDSSNNRGAAVNGAREGAGDYLLEGVDNYEQGQAGRGQISIFDKGGAAVSISPDAIQEYRVISNSFEAQYGKAGGFITDTVLKSGTNNWHGSLFEYNRIQEFTANDFFSDRFGLRDHLVRNQFGGSFGGPIIKDKTFFFGAAEIHRARQSSPVTTTGTTSAFVNFVQSGAFETFQETNAGGVCMLYLGAPCPGALSMSSTTGPVFNTLYAKGPYPLATSAFSNAAAGLYTGGVVTYPVPVYGTLTVSEPDNQDEERFSVKFDQIFSQKDKLSGVYAYQNANSQNPFNGGYNVIGPPALEDGRGQDLGITWNHTFSPTVLNTARIGYLRHRLDFPPPAGYLGIPSYLTIDGMGVDFGLYAGLPQWFTENQFQYQESLAFVKGKHSFKTGVEYRRIRNGSTFDNDRYSSALPWGIEDTMTDLGFSSQFEQYFASQNDGGFPFGIPFGSAYLESAAVNPSTGQSPDFYRGYRANEFAAYFQDDWRVNGKLTLNLGLRWDYFGPPHNFQSNIDSNMYFGSTVTPVPTATSNPFFPANNPFYAGEATAVFQIRNHDIWNPDLNNFGPRVGFAWDPRGQGKFVLRGGFGIAYDRVFNNIFENIRFNPPLFSDNQIGVLFNGIAAGAAPQETPGLLTYPFTSLSLFNSKLYAPKPNPRHMDQNLETPYYEQVHFGVQWQLPHAFVFEPEYVGTFGHKLLGLEDTNTFDGRLACPPGTYTSGPCFTNGYPNGFPTTRINTSIGADNFRTNCCSSNYHAMQLTLRRSFASGLGMDVNYTFSKALDDVSDLFNNRSGEHPTDNMNPSVDYGPADFSLKHRFVGTVSYKLPFMKNNRWLGGWSTNAIIERQSGHPFSPYDGAGTYDLNKDGYYTDRIVSTVAPMSSVMHGNPAGNDVNNAIVGGGYLKASDWVEYTCPATVNGGLWCNPPIRRGSVTGPGFTNVDFNASKAFKITETSKLTLQANFFDLFNHPNFTVPVFNLQEASFGLSQGTFGDYGGHRITQLAIRFDF